MFAELPAQFMSTELIIASVCCRMNVVDDAEVVITKQKCVPVKAEDRARAAVDSRFAVLHDEESGYEVVGLAIRRSEADNFVTSTNAKVAGAVESDEEGVGES